MGANSAKRYRWGSVQVPREHYFTSEYLSQARFLGFHAQLDACLEAGEDETFLEIGPGPGLLAALLRHFGRHVLTVDSASDLAPNVVGRLPDLPFRSGAFDVVCAFEVLEHLPLELVGPSLKEMRRIATERIILSMPDQQEFHDGMFSVRLMVGHREYHRVFWRKPLGRLSNPQEHHWEIGFEGVSPETIIDIGRKEGLALVSSYFVNPWFHFFIFDVVS